jgi:hypothetical protein
MAAEELERVAEVEKVEITRVDSVRMEQARKSQYDVGVAVPTTPDGRFLASQYDVRVAVSTTPDGQRSAYDATVQVDTTPPGRREPATPAPAPAGDNTSGGQQVTSTE